jgi:ferredoxin
VTDDDSPAFTGGGAGVVVTIDHGSCSGTAHCQQSMPDVFVVIDRKSHVRSHVAWGSVDHAQLQEAVDGCPWFAITVTTDQPS